MSGRSCSAACAVFFLRVIAWRATDRAVANRRALFCERLSQFLDRDVGRFFDEFEDRVLMSLDPVSAWRRARASPCRARALASG
jgi:hypothetical protein